MKSHHVLTSVADVLSLLLDLLLSMVAMIYEGLRLHRGPVISPSYHLHTGVGTEPAHEFHVAIHLIQVLGYVA